MDIKRPVDLFVDNKSAVLTSSKNFQNTNKRNHFNLKQKRIKEAVDNVEVRVNYISAENQLALELLCVSFLIVISNKRCFYGKSTKGT